MTAYIRSISERLMEHLPTETREHLRFYVSRKPAVNAVCFADGTILVNIGTLARMKTEAQLASILAHEISHFQEQHSLKDIHKTEEEIKKLSKRDIQRGISGVVSDDENKVIQAQLVLHDYSRKQEMEADSIGLVLLQKTKYDATDAIGALDNLNEPAARPAEDMDYWFTRLTHGTYTPDSAFFEFDTTSSEDKKESWEVDDEESEAEEDSLSKLMSTHPAIEDRLEATARQLIDYEQLTRASFVQPESQFEYITTIAQFEMLESFYQRRAFDLVFYEGMDLLEKWPENPYIAARVAASLYGLAERYYRNNLSYRISLNEDYREDSPHFELYMYFMRGTGRSYEKGFVVFSSQYLKWMTEKYPTNEAVALYYAMVEEIDISERDIERQKQAKDKNLAERYSNQRKYKGVEKTPEELEKQALDAADKRLRTDAFDAFVKRFPGSKYIPFIEYRLVQIVKQQDEFQKSMSKYQ